MFFFQWVWCETCLRIVDIWFTADYGFLHVLVGLVRITTPAQITAHTGVALGVMCKGPGLCSECVCLCVCVCEREGWTNTEREREHLYMGSFIFCNHIMLDH